MKEKSAMDGYMVEFIPLERRLINRRNSVKAVTPERNRRKTSGRREMDPLATSPAQLHRIAK